MAGVARADAHPSLADVVSYELTRLPPEEHLLATIRNARTMLDSGYTSALSAAAAKPRLDVVLNREIDARRLPRPRTLANRPANTRTRRVAATNPPRPPPHH